MKKRFITFIIGLVMLVTACNPFNGRRNSIMNFTSNNEQKIVINSDNLSLEIIYSGEMEFNDDETAIKKMSPGAYLEYRKNGGKLLAETDSRGEVYYEFYNDGLFQNPGNNGRKFLAQAIQDMIAYGVNVKGRVERLYQKGGIPLLLQETEKLKADHVKKKYYDFILDCDSVSQEEMTGIYEKIATTIGSDHEKRQLLEKVQVLYLSDSLTAHAYFMAIESMNSDFDKAATLKKILQQPLDNVTYTLALKVASGIHSDHDKANLLRELVQKGTSREENVNELLEVIATVSSDYDKAGLLKVLLEKIMIKNEDFTKPLEVTGSINSENDRSTVLKILIKNQTFENEHFDKLLHVISTIQSDHDKSEVFRKLVEEPINMEESWVSLINEVPAISSDNDKADVLLRISRKMPRSEKVKSVYMIVCRTISSEHDYARTVKDVH